MEYKPNNLRYKPISPGTIGIAQKISASYEGEETNGAIDETSKLVFLTKNEIIACGHNQY